MMSRSLRFITVVAALLAPAMSTTTSTSNPITTTTTSTTAPPPPPAAASPPRTTTTTMPQIEAVLCDEFYQDLPQASIEQGQVVRICLRSADEDASTLSRVQTLFFTQEEKVVMLVGGDDKRGRRIPSIVKAQSAVSNEGKVNSRYSTVFCDAPFNLCVVETNLLGKFFKKRRTRTQKERPTVSISGEVELEDTNRNIRGGRGGNKVVIPFSLTIELSCQ